MTSFSALRGAVCAAALVAAGAANADVTAAEVWADWQQSLALYGDDAVTIGSETMEGDTLTISDITLNMSDEFSNMTANMGDLTLKENGDGTVTVTAASSYPIEITSDEGSTMTMTVNQSGLMMIVSGTPDELVYDVTADQYGINLGEIIEDGEPLDANFRVIANDIKGSYTSSGGELRSFTYDLAAASVDVLADVVPTDIPGDYFTLSGRIEGLSTKATAMMPTGEAAADPEMIFANGFEFDGGYAYQSSAYLFDVQAEGEQTSGTARTGAGTLSAAMSQSGLRYDTNVTDVEVAVQGGGVPFPIEVAMTQYGFGIEMPLGKTDEPADFGMRVNLTDLAVNDMLWMMADPTGALPHDPATLIVDLSGQAKLLFDLLDPEQAIAMEDSDLPAELNALTLNNLSVKVGGAELSAMGDFTFDNTDLETFDGFPRPAGEVTANLKGANALVDSLVQMGLLPEDQAMMGRMMMGMFARSVGDDELSSKLEITEQGSIIANGQRIR